MNTLFPEPPPEGSTDRCLECGASFQIHVEFGQIYYPVAINLEPAEFYSTAFDEANRISTRLSDYGICTSYKMSL